MEEQKQIIADTLPKLLLHHYQRFGDSRIALREKDRGIWIKYTWADYYSIVQKLTMAFVELGLEKNDKVSIIGENKPHVYWYELASLVCGAPVVGIFSDCTPPEIKYFIDHSDSTFIVCQDQEQVDKVLQIKDELPKLKKVIYWEKKGMWSYDDPILITMDEMMEMGGKGAQAEPDLFERLINQTKGSDVAVLFYSSGTTGLAKAAVQTHDNIIMMTDFMDSRYPVHDDDESVSFLPIAWIAEQIFNVSYSLYKGFTMNFPERQETVQENIREVGPQNLLLSPRLWEEHIRTIRVKMADADWFNRFCFNVSLKVGYKIGDARMRGLRAGFIWKFLYLFADKFIFRPLRDRLGLGRIRIARTAGTAISPDVIRYFHAIGVPLFQLYGSSECGIATMHPVSQIKAETCGTPLSEYDIKVTEDSEIIVKSPCLFKEYYKAPDKTTQAIRGEWYYTGDFGRIDDDGHLIVMDRMEDLQKIAGDKVFSPQYAEIRLRFSPYIKDVLVIGREDHDYAVALINIDYNNVGNWAEANRIVYTTFMDLSQKERVVELIKKEIKEINNYLPEWAIIQKYINLHKEFDADEAELTRTR
ncbi:MAG: AMP-binding protein, partial [Spirochaetota bacterium]|nr:AMP-binding protein [Spirochaetota bacterium]